MMLVMCTSVEERDVDLMMTSVCDGVTACLRPSSCPNTGFLANATTANTATSTLPTTSLCVPNMKMVFVTRAMSNVLCVDTARRVRSVFAKERKK